MSLRSKFKLHSDVHQVSLYKPLTGELSATALEAAPDDTSIAEHLVRRIVTWEANHLPNNHSLMHVWAHTDRAQAVSRSKDLDLHDVVGSPNMKDERDWTPLDCAINANSSGTVEEFLKARCQPTKSYIMDDLSPKVVELLKTYCPSDAHSLNWALLKKNDLFKAADSSCKYSI